MKKSLVFMFAQIGFISLVFAQQEEFSITGLTSGFKDSTIVHLYDDEKQKEIDSTYIIANQFTFQGKVNGYKRYWIQCFTEDRFEYKAIWVVNSKMIVDARNSSFREAIVYGSYLQDQENELDKVTEIWEKKSDSLEVVINELSSTDSLSLKELKKQYTGYRHKRNESKVNFIKMHPDYLIGAFHLTFLKNHIQKSQVRELYNTLHPDIQQSVYGKTVKIWLEQSAKLKDGDAVIDFSLPDLRGENVSLSSFQGKYVLLEFGATGCGPCRKENPNLLKAYQIYRENGFEIVSVWLDKNRTQWEKTVAQDKMIWTTLSDLKGINGAIPLTYNVYYIPRNFLIDPEGKIIAQDLRGEKLQKALEKLFASAN